MIIDYPNSPTGKALVTSKVQPPFIPVDGYGFMGIVLQTPDGQNVQCHICGAWYKRLFRHLDTHNVSALAYKEKFGLYPTNPLTADKTRFFYSRSGEKSMKMWRKSPDSKMIKNQGEVLFLSGASAKGGRNVKFSARTVQYQNKHGTCELQLKHRLREFMKTYFDLPPNKSAEGKALLKGLIRRFGSVNAGLSYYGLPSREKMGTSVILKFTDGEIFTFNYNSYSYDPRVVWDKIQEKCQNFLTE